MADDVEEVIVAAIKRIARSREQFSHYLQVKTGLTAPQLAVLKALQKQGEGTPTSLSAQLYLSQGTTSGILERLYEKGLIATGPGARDRRMSFYVLSPKGKRLLRQTPSQLPPQVLERLGALSAWECQMLTSCLRSLADLMD
jgi:DNA-binding MarR family transcriptional regulator